MNHASNESYILSPADFFVPQYHGDENYYITLYVRFMESLQDHWAEYEKKYGEIKKIPHYHVLNEADDEIDLATRNILFDENETEFSAKEKAERAASAAAAMKANEPYDFMRPVFQMRKIFAKEWKKVFEDRAKRWRSRALHKIAGQRRAGAIPPKKENRTIAEAAEEGFSPETMVNYNYEHKVKYLWEVNAYTMNDPRVLYTKRELEIVEAINDTMKAGTRDQSLGHIRGDDAQYLSALKYAKLVAFCSAINGYVPQLGLDLARKTLQR